MAVVVAVPIASPPPPRGGRVTRAALVVASLALSLHASATAATAAVSPPRTSTTTTAFAFVGGAARPLRRPRGGNGARGATNAAAAHPRAPRMTGPVLVHAATAAVVVSATSHERRGGAVVGAGSGVATGATGRREALAGLASALLVATTQWPDRALAEDDVAVAAEAAVVPMKTFDDPAGLFSLRVPQRFFTLRRSAKGDLPDAKTGKGRRGSSIFTAGDMAKAEVIAVERLPTRSLLEDEGIDASGDLSTFPSLGKPEAIAELLLRRREKDRPGQGSQSRLLRDTVKLSDDGRTLQFQLETQIDVQKPELLLEQTGSSELVRVTLARARIVGGGGGGAGGSQIMACYASALRQDFDGPDGVALRGSVASFDAREPL